MESFQITKNCDASFRIMLDLGQQLGGVVVGTIDGAVFYVVGFRLGKSSRSFGGKLWLRES